MKHPNNEIERQRQDILTNWGSEALARYDALTSSRKYAEGSNQGRAERKLTIVCMGRNQHTESRKIRVTEALKILPEGEKWDVKKIYRQMKKHGYIWDVDLKTWRLN